MYFVPINPISNQNARPWIIPVRVSSKSSENSNLYEYIYFDHIISHDQLKTYLYKSDSCAVSKLVGNLNGFAIKIRGSKVS